MIAFESFMERQRSNQGRRDFNDVERYPLRKTQLAIEGKAYMYYTRKVFLLVQKELFHSIYSCSQWNGTMTPDSEVWMVREKINHSEKTDSRGKPRSEKVKDRTEWDDNLRERDFTVYMSYYLNTYVI